MKNMKIGAKIILGFGTVILLLVLVAGIVIFTNLQMNTNMDKIDYDSTLQMAANDLLNNFNAARIPANILYSVTSEEQHTDFINKSELGVQALPPIYEIINQKEYLEKFRPAFVEAEASFTQWKAAVEEVIKYNNEMTDRLSDMTAFGDSIKNASRLLLDNQLQNLLDDLVTDADMQFRADRIAVAREISDTIYAARLDMRKVQYSRDIAGMAAVLDNLDEAIDLVKQYKEGSSKQMNIDGADQVLSVLAQYRVIAESIYTTIENINATSEKARGLGAATNTLLLNIMRDVDDAMNSRVDEASQASSRTLVIVMVISLLSLAIGVVMALLIMRAITRPLKELTDISNKLAKGDMNVDCAKLFSKDETGQLAQSFDTMIRAIHKLIDDVNDLVSAMEAGQLSHHVDAEQHEGDYRRIVEGLNTTVTTLVGPIRYTAEVMSEMEKGNLAVRIEGEYPGEYATLQSAINSTLAAIQRYISEIDSTLSAMADGDFTVSINSEFFGDFITLKNAINSIVDKLSDVFENINIAADQVANGTAHVSDGSQAVSQGATEQASSIQELTATITEIAEQIRMTAENAGGANRAAISTKDKATDGNAQMKDMQDAMMEINESSSSISKIIKVIDDIAFQTNILALNAAVEAARAGVHGKGFAVVAEEVRNLAAKSASAARETTDLIESSIKKTATGTEIANSTAASLEEIVVMIGGAVESLGGIAAASNEQALGVTQINKGIEQLSQVVQSNSATSEQTAAAAEELSSQAALLKSMIAQFRLKPRVNASSPHHGGNSIPAPRVPHEQYKLAASSQSPDDVIRLSDDDYGKY